jgi:hypothetical protein
MNDTEKLNLLKEYALEYYDQPRVYKFVEGGFVCYSTYGTPKGNHMYIAEIFVSKAYRGTDTLEQLSEFCVGVFHTFDIVEANARTEKGNMNLDKMDKMYAKTGLTRIGEDDEAYYYRRSL